MVESIFEEMKNRRAQGKKKQRINYKFIDKKIPFQKLKEKIKKKESKENSKNCKLYRCPQIITEKEKKLI
jgi:hypothetical protein